mmetsp:Transcript_25108/g.58031  ORF Transcript_25108/g.58031 Transcript_25108/m.58031 type:complete len:203 (+) Transcript_25108:1515-2123(+)
MTCTCGARHPATWKWNGACRSPMNTRRTSSPNHVRVPASWACSLVNAGRTSSSRRPTGPPPLAPRTAPASMPSPMPTPRAMQRSRRPCAPPPRTTSPPTRSPPLSVPSRTVGSTSSALPPSSRRARECETPPPSSGRWDGRRPARCVSHVPFSAGMPPRRTRIITSPWPSPSQDRPGLRCVPKVLRIPPGEPLSSIRIYMMV